jgi:hypothetical protein
MNNYSFKRVGGNFLRTVLGPGAGCRLQVTGCRVQGAGCRVPGAGCRGPGAGCRGAGYRVPGTGPGAGCRGPGCRVPGAGCRVLRGQVQVTGCRLPGCRVLRGQVQVTGCRLPVCRLQGAGCRGLLPLARAVSICRAADSRLAIDGLKKDWQRANGYCHFPVANSIFIKLYKVTTRCLYALLPRCLYALLPRCLYASLPFLLLLIHYLLHQANGFGNTW